MKTRSSFDAWPATNFWRSPGSTHLVALALGLAVLASGRGASAAGTSITVDASKQTAGNPHFWSAAFGTGGAHLSLRSDWQTHIKIGARELGAQRLRGHGIFTDANPDDMALYNGGNYNWTNLDTYLQAITSAGMRPLVETDFMPAQLGSSSSDPIHSPPSSYSNWNAFVTAFVQHCVDKYGQDDVAKWYFEIWNEPNYTPGFWTGSMTDYYTLYDNTVGAITKVIPNALVGGPATDDLQPVQAFLQHCKSAGTPVTFASSHDYPGGAASGTTADPASLVSDNTGRISAITGAGYTTSQVLSFNTEWNSSYSGQGGQQGDATTSMDNHWNVGFILKSVKLLSDGNSGNTPPITVFSYWVLTDVFDEDGGTDSIHMTTLGNGNTPFGGVFGLMTFQGMRKAAFNAFKMLNYTGPNRLQSSGGTGNDGIDAMATASTAGDSLQVLVYNYYKTLNTASGSGDSVSINVSNLPAALANQKVWVTQFLVDENDSNPYSVWTSQGSPATPTETQWEAMRHAQHLKVAAQAQAQVTTSWTTTFSLLRQAGTMFIVSVDRPLSGQDAQVAIEGEDYDGQSGATKEDSGDSTTLGQSIAVTSGGWVYYESVDYSDAGVTSVALRVKADSATTVELHQDSQTGTLLGTCAISATSSAWATQTCTLAQPVTGVSTLYLVFNGAMHLNYLQFQGSGSTGAGGASGAGGSGSGGSSGSGAGGAGGASGASGGGSGGAGGSASGSPGQGSGGAAGGVGGSSGNGSAGTGKNGAGGSGGSTGGNSSSSGTSGSGSGGAVASGGAGGNAGVGGASGNSSASSSTSSGCSCSLGGHGAPSGGLLLTGLVAIVATLRRRRRGM
jgi:xylan 1,4-beta-xylosidase